MTNGKQYYGGYFWIALVSFIVPIFVGWKAFDNLKPTTKPTPQADASGVDHKVWDYLLKTYVTSGLVDYDGMKKDYLFFDYVRELGGCDPEALSTREEKLALICNAYNAFVIDGVISHKIRDTVDGYTVDGTGFFDLQEHVFAGKTVSLNDIEHKMVRPVFKEPRVHVALVCGARSCPSIRGEAYTGPRILEQLEDQSRLFANSPKYVKFKSEMDELALCKILSWYGGDWDERYPDGGYLEWLEGLADAPDLKQALAGAIEKKVAVTFLDYDWTLNTQADPGKVEDKPKHSGGFGSGSSPDE